MTTPARAPMVRIGQDEEQAMLRAATAAPSVQNSQPWHFTVTDRSIELRADASRQLRRADPAGRSLLISCGAALFNLRVAAEHLGFHPHVRLLPDPHDTRLVAGLTFDHRHSRPGSLDALYPAIAARRTNRRPFEERRIAPAVLASLAEAALTENADLRTYDDPYEVGRIVTLLRDAEAEERTDPGLLAERVAWVGEGRADGIPPEALGPRPSEPGAAFRDLGASRGRLREHARFERTPTVAVLSTRHDDRADWVRAGQALERVLLVATNAGLAASFMNQALERPELRWLVRSPLTGSGHPQMLMRIGYGDPVPPTPRRRVEEVSHRVES